MNNRHLHLLFNDDVQSVSLVFGPSGKSYTYLTREPIKAGQPVVVSQSGDINMMDLKVCYAVEDSGPMDIDWDANYDYSYIVTAIDVDRWQMELNAFSLEVLAGRKMEKQRSRNKMRNEITAAYKDCPELLEELLKAQDHSRSLVNKAQDKAKDGDANE